MSLKEPSVPNCRLHQPRKERVLMENRPVHPDLPSTPTAREESSIEPPPEFNSPIEVLDLFIFFQIITQDKAGPLSIPLQTTHLLTRTLRNESGLMPIFKANDHVSLGIYQQLINIEVPNEIFILPHLFCNICKVVDRQILCRRHDDNIVFRAKHHRRQAVIVCQSCTLRMFPWGCNSREINIRAVQIPALPMKTRGW